MEPGTYLLTKATAKLSSILLRTVEHPKISNVSAQVRQETDRIQSMLRNSYDSKIEAAMKMINDLQDPLNIDKLTQTVYVTPLILLES